MSCDFRETAGKQKEMFARSCAASSSTAVNPKTVEFMDVRVDNRASIVFIKDTKKDRASRPFSIQCDQFGRRIFVRTCNNFRMRRILSCTFAVTYYVVYICIGAVVIV